MQSRMIALLMMILTIIVTTTLVAALTHEFQELLRKENQVFLARARATSKGELGAGSTSTPSSTSEIPSDEPLGAAITLTVPATEDPPSKIHTRRMVLERFKQRLGSPQEANQVFQLLQSKGYLSPGSRLIHINRQQDSLSHFYEYFAEMLRGYKTFLKKLIVGPNAMLAKQIVLLNVSRPRQGTNPVALLHKDDLILDIRYMDIMKELVDGWKLSFPDHFRWHHPNNQFIAVWGAPKDPVVVTKKNQDGQEEHQQEYIAKILAIISLARQERSPARPRFPTLPIQFLKLEDRTRHTTTDNKNNVAK